MKKEGHMSINEEGFLSEEIKRYQDHIVSKYQSFFTLGKEVNQFAHKIKYELAIHNEDVQQMIAACALIKLHNNFQSIYILCTYGLIIDAKIILRSMLEILFILKLSCKDSKFVKKYVKADQIYRQKLLNAAKNNPDGVFDEARQYATEEVLNKLKLDIETNKIQGLGIEQLAKDAGMKAHYDSAYRLLCNPAHSGARSLESYLMFDENKKVSGLNFGPTDSDIDLVMITAIDNLCIGLASILNFFKIDKTSDLEDFRRQAIDLKQK